MRLLILAMLMSLCFSACSAPDYLQMDVYMGSGEELKLLHINASSEEKIAQIEGIRRAITEAEATEKTVDMMGFYPDYRVVIQEKDKETISAVVDINGDYVEFYFLDPEVDSGTGEKANENDAMVYRSKVTALEFEFFINVA